ncbi:MAG: hypothetical protein IMF11_16690 [Proteobacteria bacterium]|nr:hypothetical protein [Pseudomonadota bacterium]
MDEQRVLSQVSEVIDTFNNLEMQVSMTLAKCLVPVNSEYGFLQELVFHNTILSFGAKVQLIERILEYWSWKDLRKQTGKFKELMKIRNAFAHTPTAKRQLLIYYSPDNEFGTPLGSEFVVEKKSASSWENVERSEAFNAFKELYKKCFDILNEIYKKIEENLAQQQL